MERVSEVTIFVRVTVNDAQVEKTNAKRARLGKQSRTGAEEIINRVGEALQHNAMFEQPINISEYRPDVEGSGVVQEPQIFLGK